MKPAMALCGCVIALALAACGGAEDDWAKAKQANTAAAYRDYVAKYPQGAHVQEAQAGIDGWEWDQARKADSIESYGAYLKAYPEGPHAGEAKTRAGALREERDWSAAKSANSAEAMEVYLKANPSGKHAAEAADLRGRLGDDAAWKYAQSTNTASAYENYVTRYPAGKFVPQAKEAIEESAWRTAQAANTVDGLRRYLTAYGTGKYATQAAEGIDALDWQAAKTANTPAAWKAYVGKHPTGRFVADAMTLAEDAEWNVALKSTETGPLAAFIVSYPKSRRLEQAKTLLLERTDSQDWQAAAKADTAQAYLAFQKAHPDSPRMTVLTGTLQARAMTIVMEYGGTVLETALSTPAGTSTTLYMSLQDGRSLGLLEGSTGAGGGMVFSLANQKVLDKATVFLRQTTKGPEIISVYSGNLDRVQQSWRLAPPKGMNPSR